MIVQHNNPIPWVVLAIAIMFGCAITGMLLGNVGPLNSQSILANIEIQQTQSSLDVRSTQSALEVVQTQQAPAIQQTSVVAQMTTVPLQQTATQAAISSELQIIQMNATQTAVANGVQNLQMMARATQTSVANGIYMQDVANRATATAIAQKQVQEHLTNSLSTIMIVIGILVICSWVVARAISQIVTAQARAKTATAQLLAEQRRLAVQRANLQVIKASRNQQYPLPSSLVQKRDFGKNLPKAK